MTRVFVAGAAGAIGHQLVPMLIEAGHQVRGTTRTDERARWLRSVGAEPSIVDVYDSDALRHAVLDARPDVVVHQLTDLAAGFSPDELRANSRLRQIGTANLVNAMLAAGAGRLVAQSAAWLYASGPTPHDENDALMDPTQWPDDVVLPGILELERLVTGTTGFDGLVLRYGFVYGPGTSYASVGPDPAVHVTDAAWAAALAIERGPAGIYNIVQDGTSVSNRLARDLLRWEPTKR